MTDGTLMFVLTKLTVSDGKHFWPRDFTTYCKTLQEFEGFFGALRSSGNVSKRLLSVETRPGFQ